MFTDLHRELATAHARIRAIQQQARAGGATPPTAAAGWPAIILRTPKGWTGPDVVDGVQIEGTFRAHQVLPLSRVRENPEHLLRLEQWLRSYHPESLFDADGRLVGELAALAPKGTSGCPPPPTPTAAGCCARWTSRPCSVTPCGSTHPACCSTRPPAP